MPFKRRSNNKERKKYLVQKISIPDSMECLFYVNGNSFSAVFNSMRDLMKYMDYDSHSSYRGRYVWY